MRRLAMPILMVPLVVYRKLISPLMGRRCKYEPSCSCYAQNAIESYGALRGAILAAWRVLRCNPFSRGGYDPVSGQRMFR